MSKYRMEKNDKNVDAPVLNTHSKRRGGRMSAGTAE